ncbi:MAG: CobW family GTP-binding protein [Actinomycetota bacterium]|nr:CobW family GTP-binding protein [Actinomycetota bacterium]
MTQTRSTPVTVVGGYLGAGKTSLINRLLHQQDVARLGVLVNDFGEINIDDGLIAERGVNTISLSNGCVCCTISDSVGAALDEVLKIRPSVDHVIIEASGVAHPHKIATYGQGWPGCSLNAVIVVVNSSTIQAQSGDRFVGKLCVEQLRQADLLVLTHLDLCSDGAISELRAWLRNHTDSPLIDAHTLSMSTLIGVDKTETRENFSMPHVEFGTAHLHYANAVSVDQIRSVLGELSRSVVRIKGFVSVGESQYLVQGVGRRLTVEATDVGGHGLVAIWPSGSCDPRHVNAVLAQLDKSVIPLGATAS